MKSKTPFNPLIYSLLLILTIFFSFKLNFYKEEDEKATAEEIPPRLSCLLGGKIKKDQPLYLSLLENGGPQNLVHTTSEKLKEVFDPKKCVPGDSFVFCYDDADSLVYFEYLRGLEQKFVIERKDGEVLIEKKPVELTCVVKGLSGEVNSSLWESMNDKCQEPELVLKFADIFAWQIDFLTEVRDGDEFRLLFEEYYKDNQFVRYGDILAGEYRTSGNVHQAVLYQDKDGIKEYYDPSGACLKKALLRSPLNYRRISSRFSYSRLHPIYKVYRPHLGVDYAAPTGTPVVSAGDGRVIFCGWKRGLGKTIVIKHPKGFETYYGHLSRFAQGMKKGVSILQKQLIGYVGQTGVATGPHLDYRCRVGGRFVNPLKMEVPSTEPIKKEYLSDFKEHAHDFFYTLDLLTGKDVFTSTN